MQQPKKKAERQGVLARLAESAAAHKIGAETLLDWLGHGAIPVETELAYRRALICANCRLNEKIKWYEFIKTGVAKAIIMQERLRNGAGLSTIYDEKLGSCRACKCYLKLKVWVPLSHIEDNLDRAQVKKLDPDCWVLTESKMK